jgi:hypothetical protein
MSIVRVFTGLSNRYIPALVDVSIELLVAVADGTWCRLILVFVVVLWWIVNAIMHRQVGWISRVLFWKRVANHKMKRYVECRNGWNIHDVYDGKQNSERREKDKGITNILFMVHEMSPKLQPSSMAIFESGSTNTQNKHQTASTLQHNETLFIEI